MRDKMKENYEFRISHHRTWSPSSHMHSNYSHMLVISLAPASPHMVASLKRIQLYDYQ